MLLLNSSCITSAHQSLYSHYSPIILRLSLKNCTVSTSSFSSSSSSISSPIVSLRCGVPMAAIFSSSTSSDFQEDKQTLTGVNFQPFVEIRDHLVMVPSSSSVSLARQNFNKSCESALNEQINIEYNASYFYHNLFAYFDRDNVGLPGFAKFFKESSDEEREHAEKIMKYQNKRGGKVKLNNISFPTITEFDDAEKGDALRSMELTLALEKLVYKKLLKLHKAAEVAGDAQLADFVKVELLKPQVDDIKKISSYVSQLRRIGKGHGVYRFDLMLL